MKRKRSEQEKKELLGEIIGQMMIAEFTRDEHRYYDLLEERVLLEHELHLDEFD